MQLEPGYIFGNFQIVKALGQGATGTVYLARQTNLGRECALKVLAPELVRDGKFLERFRREGQIAASLRHNHIVRIFDLVEADGAFAIAMDYIEGVELQKLLENGEKLSVTRALRIMLPVFEAVEYAHSKGVVHRDIKPANILIEDASGDAFLTDFSIARMAGADKLTQTGTIIGTPEYMAPEQFDGKDVDGRADLYAATLILYEMLAGLNPFRGETLAEVVKKQILDLPPPLRSLADIPPALEAIIHKGLSKGPEDRIQTAKEMKETLRSFQSEVSTTLIEPSPQRNELLQHLPTSVESEEVCGDDAIIVREKMKEMLGLPAAETSQPIEKTSPIEPPQPALTPLRTSQTEAPPEKLEQHQPCATAVPAMSSAPVTTSVPARQEPETVKVAPLNLDEKSHSRIHPPEATGPWWGWRYLGLSFFLFWGSTVLSTFAPVPESAVKLFRVTFALCVVALPPYSIYALLRRRLQDAKQSMTAFVIFFLAFVYVVIKAA